LSLFIDVRIVYIETSQRIKKKAQAAIAKFQNTRLINKSELPVRRWISSEVLTQSVVLIVKEYRIIRAKIVKRVDLKCSHHKKEVVMWCDGGIS